MTASTEPGTSGVPLAARDIQGHRAGIVTRVLAGCVDVVVIAVVMLGSWLGWAVLRFLRDPQAFTFPAPSLGLVLAEGYVLSVLYLTFSWAIAGRSYGGQLLGLRVLSFRGRRMSWPGSLLRAAFCVFFPIGLAWILLSRGNRSVQDVVLRTSVVYDWSISPAGEPSPDVRRAVREADAGGGGAEEHRDQHDSHHAQPG